MEGHLFFDRVRGMIKSYLFFVGLKNNKNKFINSGIFLIFCLCIFNPIRANAQYPVDVFVDFETGNNGDGISKTSLDSVSYGMSGWNNQNGTDHMYISEDAYYALEAPVQVGETVYTGSGDSRGFKFDPEGTTHNYYWSMTLPEPFPEEASFGAYWKTTSTNDPAGSVTMGFSGYGDYVVTHNRTLGGGPAMRIKDGDTGAISLTTNTWYYVTGVWRTGGLNELYIFNPSTGLLLGKTSVPNVSSDGAVVFSLGRSGADGTSGTGEYYWDNIMLSYSGIFPLIPITPKAAVATYDKNPSITYDNSVTVSAITITPDSSIYYCTDTTGTCSPNTLYTAPISVNQNGTHLRSEVRRSGWTTSDITDSTYTINNWRGPTVVQSCAQAIDGTSCTFSANVTEGNVIAVFGGSSNNGAFVSITDNCGTAGGGSNTYTTKTNNTAWARSVIGYTTVGASKSCTVTVNYSGDTLYMTASEITNINPTTPVASDQYTLTPPENISSPGTGTDALVTTSVTTTKNNTLIWGSALGSVSGFWAGLGTATTTSLTKYGTYSIIGETKNQEETDEVDMKFTISGGYDGGGADALRAGIMVFQRPDTYYVTGSVSGLSGTLVLQNNGGDDLSITSNGSFKFNPLYDSGSAYNVTALSQPVGKNCVITGGSGTIDNNDASVSIMCYSTSKSISSFGFNSLSPSVNGSINESNKTVSLVVPSGTSVTSLTPTITISTGASVSPNSGVAQNFTTPVVYTVTAEDSSTVEYTVTVTVLASEDNGTETNTGPRSSGSRRPHTLLPSLPPISSIESQIKILQQQVNILREALRKLSGDSSVFLRGLSLGMKGEDVRLLQKKLNEKGFILTVSGPGSPGQETDNFGVLTYKALVGFQKKNGIPATGYFGPLSKEALTK